MFSAHEGGSAIIALRNNSGHWRLETTVSSPRKWKNLIFWTQRSASLSSADRGHQDANATAEGDDTLDAQNFNFKQPFCCLWVSKIHEFWRPNFAENECVKSFRHFLGTGHETLIKCSSDLPRNNIVNFIFTEQKKLDVKFYLAQFCLSDLDEGKMYRNPWHLMVENTCFCRGFSP